MLHGILRDVNAGDTGARQHLRKLLAQETFATAHIENAGSWLKLVTLHQALRDRPPATVIVVAAVAILPFAVPIFFVEPDGHLGARRLIMFQHALAVISLGPAMCL